MNMQKVRFFFLVVTVIAFLLSTVTLKAEEEPLPTRKATATYKVTDVIKKEITFQEIEITLFSQSSTPYKLIRKGGGTTISFEIEDGTSKVFHVFGKNHYVKQSLNENPDEAKPNERIFGRLEIISIPDDKIILASPIFGILEEKKSVRILTLTTFLSQGRKIIVTHTYKKGMYHLPTYSHQVYLDEKGEVLNDILFSKM